MSTTGTEELEPTEIELAPPEEETEETPAEEAAEANPDEDGYEFADGTKFKTQKEAIAYQQELLRAKDLELAQADAYRQAALDLQRPQVQQAPTTEESSADWESRFYQDPKKAIAEVEDRVHQRIMSAQETRDADERIWNNFKEANPDLADFREDLQAVVFQNQELIRNVARTRGEKAAMDLAAQKVRAKFERYVEMKKPKKELGKDKSVTPQSTQTNVTAKKGEEKPMSMLEQMAKLKEKRRR